ncbi:hypothetical protein ACFXTH_036620 [Malus domestica]
MTVRFQVIKHTKYSTASVPPLFEESFKKAILTFQHQRVHGSVSQDIVYLSDEENVSADRTYQPKMSILEGQIKGKICLCRIPPDKIFFLYCA